MGCSFCDDCADCTVGRGLDCDNWDSSEHGQSVDDDDWYEDDAWGGSCEDTPSLNSSTEAETREWHCTTCGESVRPDWKYCLKCGAPVYARYCVNCGGAIEGNWRYCPACGEPIPAKAQLDISRYTMSRLPIAPGPSSVLASERVDDDDIPF